MLVTQTLTEEDTFPCIVMFVGSESNLLTVSYSAKYFSFMMNIAEDYCQMTSSSCFVCSKFLVMK